MPYICGGLTARGGLCQRRVFVGQKCHAHRTQVNVPRPPNGTVTGNGHRQLIIIPYIATNVTNPPTTPYLPSSTNPPSTVPAGVFNRTRSSDRVDPIDAEYFKQQKILRSKFAKKNSNIESNSIQIEATNCCVCDDQCECDIICKHIICNECLNKLKKPQCPMCRGLLEGPSITSEILANIINREYQDEMETVSINTLRLQELQAAQNHAIQNQGRVFRVRGF